MGVKNSIVYLFGFSSRFEIKLRSLLEIVEEQIEEDIKISIVLIHDGVIGVSKKELTPPVLNDLLKHPVDIYAMIPDIKARGIDYQNLLEKIKGINYDDLVDILVSSQKIVSWM